MNDENLKFGTDSNAHDEHITALENGEYDHGYDDIKRSHVLEWMYNDEGMSVQEIGERTGVKDWLISKCLAYHRIDGEAYQGPAPKHPPWKPNPNPDAVKSVSGGRSLGVNHK